MPEPADDPQINTREAPEALAHLSDVRDLLTDEHKQQLRDDLERMARQRRRAEAESRNVWMG